MKKTIIFLTPICHLVKVGPCGRYAANVQVKRKPFAKCQNPSYPCSGLRYSCRNTSCLRRFLRKSFLLDPRIHFTHECPTFSLRDVFLNRCKNDGLARDIRAAALNTTWSSGKNSRFLIKRDVRLLRISVSWCCTPHPC